MAVLPVGGYGSVSFATEVRWRGKILAKIVLSRLPVSYHVWRRVGIFRHGHMRSGDYAIRVFEQAVERVGLRDVQGLRLLELGPGDSLFSAVLARAAGAAGSLHVDVGDFADRDPEHYREFAHLLEERGYEPTHLSGTSSLEDVLERCNARYLTHGLQSVRQLPAARSTSPGRNPRSSTFGQASYRRRFESSAE